MTARAAANRPDAATERQIHAARPGDHVWVPANAGSGKTRVLTNRVIRLLSEGTPPQNILCLTYTKAAASEMQNRLFTRLGDWAMLPDAELERDLRALGVAAPFDAAGLASARRLFASAIEAPGGLRIQTIHAFCAGLLRRFPLEAGVSPQFAEIEDRAADLLREDIADELARTRTDIVAPMADLVTDEDFRKLTRAITAKAAFARPPDPAALALSLGLPADFDDDLPLRIAWSGSETALAGRIADCFRDQSKSYAEFAATLCGIDHENPSWAGLETLCSLFLYAKDQSSKSRNFPQSGHGKAVAAAAPIAEELHDWMDRVAEARAVQKALDCFRDSLALHRFGHAFHAAYTAAKAARGWLDFDDLITRARALLADPAVAAWVLFKLDGGIDHILVDEAQDTSPDQWEIIARLAEDFATGEGARPEVRRTLFVVGDRKQSIYSFQGADPDAFDRMRQVFASRFEAAQDRLFEVPLEHSFRSSTAILSAVDRTFEGAAADGVGIGISHVAYHGDLPGRVELWPPLDKDEADDAPAHWADPVDRPSPRDPKVRLAEMIADRIRQMIADGERIPVAGHNGAPARSRPVTAGDVLILVRRRSGIFPHLIRACKAAGLDIAGADRLKIGGELAVKDLAALLQFLALPEDDLSLACVLRSPLIGWDEQALFTLAHRRPEGQYLWTALRETRGPDDPARRLLDDLRDRADFLRPFDLIDRVLNRWNGRARLLARLGDEAEDGIDALLSQALAYEETEVPSLTGFLGWLQSEEVEIKRQMDSQGDRLRVMTVHGAKGLEAPIVILPDSEVPRWQVRGRILYAGDGVPVWKPKSDAVPPVVARLSEDILAAERREWRRLLYVAMTRAESRLIVCAAGKTGAPGDSWHSLVADGMTRLATEEIDTPAGPGLAHVHGDIDRLELADRAGTEPVLPQPLPDLGPVPPARRSAPLSPSDLGGAKVLPGEPEAGLDGEAARARGTLLHRLLEHLPAAPPETWADLAERLIAAGADGLPVPDPDGLFAEARGLLRDPGLAHLFAPGTRAEAALSAPVPVLGGQVVYGAIDRLIVAPDRVLAVDYKTNRIVPESPEAVPEGLLRQMGAYAAMLAEVFPDRAVETAILWTRGPRLMPLPAALIAAALGRVTLP